MSEERHYVLRIPVSRGQYVTLWSNKPMKPQHFAKLDEYLALQKEVAAEELPCDREADDRT